MNDRLKKAIKQMLTIARHPIITFWLYGSHIFSFYMGKNIRINKLKYFSPKGFFSIDSNARILFTPYYHGTYNPRLTIGEKVDIGPYFTALSAEPIIIDDYSLIAANVTITSSNHGMNPESDVSYASQPLSAAKVHIGEGCWIGQGATILPGVELGKKCIVAAGAVVTKSFPDYCLVGGGVPAKLLKRYNFQSHQWENMEF